MGLLEGTDQQYYEGNDHGSYQFVTLDDIITQFEIAYVGEDKIISKVRRADIAFHAQRALQEFSFDTLKSIKAHEIVLPPSLSMVLPRDYVNYTKLSTVDTSGVKHLLYPTTLTSNPFSIKQSDDGSYSFIAGEELIDNPDFNSALTSTESTWEYTHQPGAHSGAWWNTYIDDDNMGAVNYRYDKLRVVGGKLQFESFWHKYGLSESMGREYGVWQEIDVSNMDFVTLSATGASAALIADNVDTACGYGILRIGLSSIGPEQTAINVGSAKFVSSVPYASTPVPSNENGFSVHQASALDLGYVEWTDGTSSTKELEEVDVSMYSKVWVWVQSKSPWTDYARHTPAHQDDPNWDAALGGTTQNNKGWNVAPGKEGERPHPFYSTFHLPSTNTVSSVKLVSSTVPNSLRQSRGDKKSNTQARYNASQTTDTDQKNYLDDTYWPVDGTRYGLDPQQAQVNGSFFIDNRLGKVNFSSNIAGKTVILDYISDSLGTDGEMQVHKFAEEAMYKHIAYAVLSTRANTQEYIVQRFKKERFAETRKAKLRLSNIKLEELTQILRGKSKQIKH